MLAGPPPKFHGTRDILSWKTMITQNGMATIRVGMIDAEAMNQDWAISSRHWNGRRNTDRTKSAVMA